MTDRRHAIAFNALGSAINHSGHWLPFTARQAAVNAVLAAIDADARDDARQASGHQPDTETVPTPEEGIEDARKVMQHVLQLFLDRVPRAELDAETMADSLADALSDGLTELYRTAAQAASAAGLDDNQPANEARPADHSWTVFKRGETDWLVASGTYTDRDCALERLAKRRSEQPDAEFRVVRETTTWTVEEDETR